MVNSTRCSITLAFALACGFAGAFAAVPQTRANAFPKIANWNSLVITHEHLGCFGSCPTYRLEIHGDGTVLYNGKAFVDFWLENPWTNGSYSYWKVGQYTAFAGMERARQGNCHFAGEHTSIDFQGYLNGAVERGQRAAGEILADLK